MTRAVQKLIIHIGAPKAGSTSMQRYLSQKRNTLLATHSLAFPRKGCGHLAHHNLAYGLSEKYRRTGKFEPAVGDWDETLAEIAASGAETAVVSSEAFFRVPKAAVSRVAALTTAFDVTIVALVRRQDLTLESSYNQLARHGRVDVDLREYLKGTRHLFEYPTFVDRWAEAFGDERIHVIPFEKRWIAAGITNAVLSRCGVDAQELPGTEPRANQKAGWKHIQGVRYVQERCRAELGADFKLPSKTIVSISRRFRGDPTDVTSYMLIDFDVAVEVFESYRDSNRRLAQRFGTHGGPEFFFSPPVPHEYRAGPASADLSADDLEHLDRIVELTLAPKTAGPTPRASLMPFTSSTQPGATSDRSGAGE
jgi:hypothetical protein